MARRLVVHSGEQIALLYENGDIIRRYRISTAAKGLGCAADSNCTPHGRLTIAQKIGFDLPEGANAVFERLQVPLRPEVAFSLAIAGRQSTAPSTPDRIGRASGWEGHALARSS